MQTIKYSMIESISNVIAGYIVAFISQLIIFPFFDIAVSFEKNIYISLWFTGVSLLRSFILRRIFNKK